MQWRKLSLA